GIGGWVSQHAEEHSAGSVAPCRGYGLAMVGGRGLEPLHRRAEVRLERSAPRRDRGKVIRLIEPGQVLDPSQRQECTHPETFSARSRLAAECPRRIGLGALKATGRQPSHGPAREDLVGTLREVAE